MQDISKLGVVDASEKGASFPLRNPFDRSPTGATFDIIGYDSPTVVEAVREYARRSRNKGLEPDELHMGRRVAMAVSALRGWSGFVFGGEELPYTREKAQEILGDPNFVWILEQIEDFGGSRKNFIPTA